MKKGMQEKTDETIAAISTPSGRGGIGIIRISGKDALRVAKKIFFVSKDSELFQKKNFVSRRMYHGFILNPNDKTIIDEVLFVYMKAAGSYTREEVVEIHTHGGAAASKSVLNLILNYGVKTAAPGEFTKKAFLNGRIDLSQAEAVIDIINASNSKALSFAASQAFGALKEKTDKITDEIRAVLSIIEASIDFSDDTEDDFDFSPIIDSISGIIEEEITPLIDFYESALFYRDGIIMTIAGRPNVGKSSLLNRFAEAERAIVTDIPGTTRDVIEVRLNFLEIPLILADTAGIHTSKNPIEIIGIERTKEYLKNSDLALFIIDGSIPLSEEDFKIYEDIKDKKHIIVINKSDIAEEEIVFDIKKRFDRSVIAEISSLYNRGISELKDIIINMISGFTDKGEENSILLNMRQKKELALAREALQRAIEGLRSNNYLETISIELRDALQFVGHVSGASVGDDVLEQIFANFCVGK